jgi:probable H4MPT-linked C1 transfer pathway protein
MSILGLDIGGANIKAADGNGRTLSRPFAIWKYPEQLASQIAILRSEFPSTDQLAVTMTAELADCFATKTEGVRFILDQLSVGHPTEVLVWTTAGEFVTAEVARQQPMQVAAANWHALATWVGKHHLQQSASTAVLIDIGTTTTDIIPFANGRPATVGLTDTARLQSGELCYSGIKRTPVCSIAHSVPFRDSYCPLAGELFATTLDIYLLLGDIPEDESDLETANGKLATKAAAHDRLVRMLCADRDEISFDESVDIARFLADVQRQRLAGALERVAQRFGGSCDHVVVSGSGAFLARRLIADHRRLRDAMVISLDQLLSPGVAEAACAYAVAQLAANRTMQ